MSAAVSLTTYGPAAMKYLPAITEASSVETDSRIKVQLVAAIEAIGRK